jgi:sterol desaturase/sphingolipid hydroxylase (fatty acid hydroxylase superfamily)
MKTESMLGLAVPLLFFVMLLVEARSPARAYQPVERWRWLGIGFFALTAVVGSLLPFLLPVPELRARSFIDLSGMGMWGFVPGMLATTFVGYWVHRAEHRYAWLWRATHQLHHSPLRVDTPGAFYAHPFEVVLKVTVSTVVATLVLGLSPLAASAVNTAVAVLSLFQHWNIHTPRMLGYLIQRPESHAVHHARGDSGHNFSELPLWDLMFGTFSNPHRFEGEVGLDSGHAPRVSDMLLMRSGPR